jgi:hexosaminidase
VRSLERHDVRFVQLAATSVMFSLLLLFIPTYIFSSTSNAPLSLSVGQMQLHYSAEGGITLTYNGVVLIKHSSLWIMSPDWKHRYYGIIDHPQITTEAEITPYENGKRVKLVHTTSGSPFEAIETLTLLPPGQLDISLIYELKEDVPAIIEYNVAGLNPIPIVGCSYAVQSDSLTTHGIIPVEPRSPEVGASTIRKGFDRLDVHSRLGLLTIATKSEQGWILFDYRLNRWAIEDNPYFWFGILERPIEPHRRYTLDVSFRLQSRKQSATVPASPSAPRVTCVPVDTAVVPMETPQPIIPQPKQIVYSPQAFFFNGETAILMPDSRPREKPDSNADADTSVESLRQDLAERYGLALLVMPESKEATAALRNVILLGEPCTWPLLARLCKEENVTLPDKPEGYALTCTNKYILIAGTDKAGTFYGVQTLLQLIRSTPEGIICPGVSIADFPTLRFRGVHCLTGKGAGEEMKKAIRLLMARHKINHMILEAEYINWESHPEIHHPAYGMDKDEAREVVEYARRHFINVIPLVQALGHCEWIFTNGQHLDLAEDPETPYAYSPTNPDTYRFLFEIYDEAVELFQPAFFHIGHDEVTMRGRFPFREASRDKSVTELLMMDIEKLHAYFQPKQIRMMLWGDMFLAPTEVTDAGQAGSVEEARERRNALPKDVVICDWHYIVSPPEAYRSIKIFQDAGFDVIPSAWYRPRNIAHLCQAAAGHHTLGFLQTTWAGFNFKIADNEKEWHQYWAYLLAADYAWSGRDTAPAALPYLPGHRFLNLWYPRELPQFPRKGFLVDLRELYNRPLADNREREGWLGYGPELDLSSFPVHQPFFDNTRFLLAGDTAHDSAVLLSCVLNPDGTFPQEVSIPVGRSACELVLLLTLGFQVPRGTQVGQLAVRYADGTESVAALMYGQNCFAFDDQGVSPDALLVWSGTSQSGRRISVRSFRWINPHPEKAIQSVTLSASESAASPILLGMTGVL